AVLPMPAGAGSAADLRPARSARMSSALHAPAPAAPRPQASPCPQAVTRRATTEGIRQVALLIETSGSYGRGLLQGIAKYNRDHGGWSTYFRPHGLTEAAPSWL